jgi:hypothetical protein
VTPHVRAQEPPSRGHLLCVGPDGRSLLARSETGLQVWRDIHSGEKAVVHRDLDRVAPLRFLADGETLFVEGLRSGYLHVSSGKFSPFPDREYDRYCSLTTDGKHLLVVQLLHDRAKNRIECWPAERPFQGKPRPAAPPAAS